MQLSTIIGKPIVSPEGEDDGYVVGARLSRNYGKIVCLVCSDGDEEEYFYVTFKDEKTPSDMQDILLSVDNSGTIKVLTLYLSDMNAVTGSDNIRSMFDENEENIAAVKILCPGNLYRKLQDNELIYLVESGDTFKEDAFTVLTDTDYDYQKDYEIYGHRPTVGDTTPIPDPEA